MTKDPQKSENTPNIAGKSGVKFREIAKVPKSGIKSGKWQH